MKEDQNFNELRSRAEEIRSAVMPKSITPEMVGGVLADIVDAVEEASQSSGTLPVEHVKVTVRGYDGTGSVSGAGATVWLDVFTTQGAPAGAYPRRELIADEDGVVEFDVPQGFMYALFSQIDGLGASFQYVCRAAGERRNIGLWNLPVGIHVLINVSIMNDGNAELGVEEYTRGVPYVTDFVAAGMGEYADAVRWDLDEEIGEYAEGWEVRGVLVSTADTSYVITPSSKLRDAKNWCGPRDFGKKIPGLKYCPMRDEDGRYIGGSWNAAYYESKERALADMDGNMNTAMYMGYYEEPLAAPPPIEESESSGVGLNGEQRFVPSAGQLYIMWLNMNAINTLINQLNEVDLRLGMFSPLSVFIPSKTINVWTSTAMDAYRTFYASNDTGAPSYGATFSGLHANHKAKSVSVFPFIYSL